VAATPQAPFLLLVLSSFTCPAAAGLNFAAPGRKLSLKPLKRREALLTHLPSLVKSSGIGQGKSRFIGARGCLIAHVGGTSHVNYDPAT